ncbi:MAG: ArnT family glycosyltransferase, partial [Thermoanaerobaculia bacterium]
AIRWRAAAAVTVATLPLVLLALYPPIAFDETLYHLPFVRAIAETGAIQFRPDLRFPAFPQLHELLCVPAFLVLGDVATHFVAVAEGMLLVAILFEWGAHLRTKSGGMAAALQMLGNPIVIQLATVAYVDMAMTLFIAAGFYCLDRTSSQNQTFHVAAAGFFLGSACSVKYLGCYFAAAALVFLLLSGTNRRRTTPIFLLSFAAAVLPMYSRITALTGNPFFPFLPKLFGPTPWTITLSESSGAVRVLRLFWDITFAREHVNQQPPYSPLFAVALLITIIAATRDRRAVFLSAICAGYIAIFTFLPQDSRYLLPLLPLVSVAAACAVARWKKVTIAVSLLSIAAGIAYAGYRLARQGPPPLNAAQRRQYLEQRIPEYRALERRGSGRIYVCGAEQLKYFGGDDLLGDVIGPLSTEKVFGSSRNAGDLSSTLARLGVRYLLVSRTACRQDWQRLPVAPAFEPVYADAGAVLWRVRFPSATESR